MITDPKDNNNIIQNESLQNSSDNMQWRLLGDILVDLELVTVDQINKAIKKQQLVNTDNKKSEISFQKSFLNWLNSRNKSKSLGDILIEMQAIAPRALRQGLLDQTLPPSILKSMSKSEITSLLQMAMTLHGFQQDPWVFEQIIEMSSDLLGCLGGSILLIVPHQSEMIIAASTVLLKEHFQGKTIPTEKGIAGWVTKESQSLIINSVENDDRFDPSIDRRVNEKAQSVLAVPMHVNGASIGVLEFFNKKDKFNNHDSLLVLLVANIVASALGTIFHLSASQ